MQKKDDDVQSEDDLITHTKVQVLSNLEEAVTSFCQLKRKCKQQYGEDFEKHLFVRRMELVRNLRSEYIRSYWQNWPKDVAAN